MVENDLFRVSPMIDFFRLVTPGLGSIGDDRLWNIETIVAYTVRLTLQL